MDPYAEMGCVLKVNVHCDACKMKLVEVLSALNGVYSVTIDAQEGTARIAGEVDPNILLGALARSGRHAELVRVNLKHPALKRSHNYNENYSSYDYNQGSYGYGSHGYCDAIDGPYHHSYGMSQMPEVTHTWYDANPQNYPYSWYEQHGGSYPPRYNYGSYNYGSQLPQALHVPSRPSAPPYDQYMDDAYMSFCSIM